MAPADRMGVKEGDQLLRELRRGGCTAQRTGRGHYRVTHPDAPEPLYLPNTPRHWFVHRRRAMKWLRGIGGRAAA